MPQRCLVAISSSPGECSGRPRPERTSKRQAMEWPVGGGSRLDLAPQPDDVRNWTCLDTSSASRTGIRLDHVRLPVAADPCPEPVSKRQEPLVFDSQLMDFQDTVGASRDARALGVSASMVVPTLALGAVDGWNEDPRLLLPPDFAHVVSPRQRTAMGCMLDRYRSAESRPCPLVQTSRRGLARSPGCELGVISETAQDGSVDNLSLRRNTAGIAFLFMTTAQDLEEAPLACVEAGCLNDVALDLLHRGGFQGAFQKPTVGLLLLQGHSHGGPVGQPGHSIAGATVSRLRSR